MTFVHALARAALAAGLAASLSALGTAQTITSVTPEAVAPGTPMTITGTGLGATTHVRFQAVVGGFVGVWTQDEPVTGASATQVTVLAPDIVAGFVFVGPSTGSPFAQLQTVDPGGTSPMAKVYLLEGSDGFLASAGLGTTNSAGERASASFKLAGGPPASPNPSFAPSLHDAVPGALPVLAIGLPLAPVPFGDGQIAVNPTFAFLVGSLVDTAGNASTALPVPPGVPPGITVGLQWGYLDPVGGAISISNAMHVAY